MKCLITGINGFAGSYLAEYLLENNIYEIYGTVYPPDSIGNIKSILNGIKIFQCDLSSEEPIQKIIDDIKPDRIFHLAAQGFVPLSWQDPVDTFKTNVLGTLYLLYSVKKSCPSAKVLIIGSGEEYNHVNGNSPITEETMLLPKNPYALTKLCSDLASSQIGSYFNLNIIRVRPFSHIGPRQSPNFVVSDFSKQIAMIEKDIIPPLIKVGNLDSFRDFTDVRDMVKAYAMAIENCDSGDVYNISSEKSYSIKQILDILLSFSIKKISVEVDHNKFRINDIPIRLCSSRKFRDKTGWRPAIQIKQSLEFTLNWWRNNI